MQTMTSTDGTATVSQVHAYAGSTRTCPVGYAMPAHFGPVIGYAAHAYGAYRPGGNPVLEGPTRATVAEAQADAANPATVYTVTGYSI